MTTEAQQPDHRQFIKLIIVLAVIVGGVGSAAFLIDWRSGTQHLADEIDTHAFQRTGSAAAYNHLIPSDLDRRDPSLEFLQDLSPQIDGEETMMTSYYLSSELTVAKLSYDGLVWGYLLTTGNGSVAIVDTNRDGEYDRMYRANEPIYIPDWTVAIADGS